MAKPAERSAARLATVQALYQVEGITFKPAENEFFRDILGGIVREQRAIDGKIDAALSAGWPLKRIEAVLRAILRAGAYELLFRKDVPVRVVISEYVEVAHSFYSEDEPGLVNAVLDAIGREVRGNELGERRAARSGR